MNNLILNERANSIKSVEKNSNSLSNTQSNKINSKIIASIKSTRIKNKINSLKDEKYISNSGINVSKFNDSDKNKRIESIERNNKISCFELKQVSSVKNLIKIPSNKSSSNSLKYNFSTININSFFKNKNPNLIKQNSGLFNRENIDICFGVEKDIENKENIDFNRTEKECISLPTGSTLATSSNENPNLKIPQSKNSNLF